jgi:hypothetical protein
MISKTDWVDEALRLVECLKAVALLVFSSPFTILQSYLINISKPHSSQSNAKMKLFRLLLITPFLTATQTHALLATSDSNEITKPISRRDNAFWNFWDNIPAWFGVGEENARVANMGLLECASDASWRKTGFCAKAGR